MASTRNMTSEAISAAMLEGVRSHLRAALREQFEAAAKPIIEDAISGAMATFEVSIVQFLDVQNMAHVVKVILDDMRTKTATP